jgi:hypothetical protein
LIRTWADLRGGCHGWIIPLARDCIGEKFNLPMATIGRWENGKMDHEWLYWDDATYMAQLESK